MRKLATKSGLTSYHSEVLQRDFNILAPGHAWFNTVMCRGFFELYSIDKNPSYLEDVRNTMLHAWFGKAHHISGLINDEDLINNGCDFSKGVEFVDATDSSPVITLIKMIAPNLKAPAAGATSYQFPLGEFFQAVSIYQTTTSANGHVFKIV